MYMEDGIENCDEWSLQAANQVLLFFGPIENPRWPPAGDTRVEKNVRHVQAQGFLNFFNPSPVSDLPSPNL
jgi:hypothetical protein